MNPKPRAETGKLKAEANRARGAARLIFFSFQLSAFNFFL